MLENLLNRTGSWSLTGSDSDVVISTRVRLARNFPSLPFPHMLKRNDLHVLEAVIKNFTESSSIKDNIIIAEIPKLDEIDRRYLRERGLITIELEHSPHSFALIDHDEKFAILVNEEDHFRIHLIRPGFEIWQCLDEAKQIDEELNKVIPYAFSPQFGHLTSRPANAGCGLKISLMLFLPTYTIVNPLSDSISLFKSKNITMRGIIGETIETVGSLYLLSNAGSLGFSEKEIEEQMESATHFLIGEERKSRELYYSQNRKKIDDRTWRSWGILAYSRSISYSEAMEHLSNLRLGILLSLIKNIDLQKINDLMINIQWSHLQRIAGRNFISISEADEFRADYLRGHIQQKEKAAE